MFMNFLDFTDDACMNMFTYGQKNKMRGIFSLTGARNSFLNSMACDSSLAEGSPLPDIILPPETGISVYPNPVIDILNIKSQGIELAGQVAEIISIEGKKLGRYILSSNNESIDLGKLPGGVYLLKIGIGKERRIFKIVKI
jgi:hypothetical protein